ncbi:MAG TPA: site-specific integrase [Acidobacteriaceae bacterium]|nr:site-specific integrase [Acidobacteriaceae bacterium]
MIASACEATSNNTSELLNPPVLSSTIKPRRNFLGKRLPRTSKLKSTTGSTARKEDLVQRRRFQKGSVYQNKTKTLWKGGYSEYVLNEHGVEVRKRREVMLGPVKKADGATTTKREAQRLLQPFLDKVNSSIASPATARKSATFMAFSEVWERDYLSLCKPATQVSERSNLKRLKAAFGEKDIRLIDAGDLQRFIASSTAEGLSPKTIRNLWGTVSRIWDAAHAQKFVDAVLPKPKLPRRRKPKPRTFTLPEVAKIIASSQGGHRVFYWLAAETGLRAGELAGLKLDDIDGERLRVDSSIWGGNEQAPKTENALRTLAISPQLLGLLWEQVMRQKQRGHEYLFSSSTGTPRDMNCFRGRKMKKHLESVGIVKAGFHAFRHFNSGMMLALGVPLTVVKERMGHAAIGIFTVDVYGGQPDWQHNLDAARRIGGEIERAVAKEEQQQTAEADVSLTTVAIPETQTAQEV